MANYVLIWILFNPSGVYTSGSAGFRTLAACENARDHITKEMKSLRGSIECYEGAIYK